MSIYATSNQRQIELGTRFKGGGEGNLFDVLGAPDLVAKIYHPAQRTPQREPKLRAMIARPPRDKAREFNPPHTSIAWPVDILYERGLLAGFLMPRIEESPEIFEIYNPALRAKKFPMFDWHYLHHTANNVARGISAFHECGHVMGDVNQKNILVARDALVSFVDTDSYQIADRDGRILRCTVGVGEYTPREMQQKSFAQVDRAPCQDCFGLAVLTFQLLMEGYHPFTGAPKDPSFSVPDGLFLHCIKKGVFPYERNRVVVPPPNAPRFDALHPKIQALFLRCFIDGHRKPESRPTAREWIAALDAAEAELVRCGKNPLHYNAKHAGACQWCERETRLAAVPAPKTGTSVAPVAKDSRETQSVIGTKKLPRVKWLVAAAALVMALIVTAAIMFHAAALPAPRDSAHPTLANTAPAPKLDAESERKFQAAMANARKMLRDYPRDETGVYLFPASGEAHTTLLRELSDASKFNPASPEPAALLDSLSTPPRIVLSLPNSACTFQFALVPAGEFEMGSPPAEENRRKDETLHAVAITHAFYLGTTEVTQAQYREIMRGNPSHFRGDNLPVDSVTWDEAAEFCAKLARMTALKTSLPSEAQWEYACRAGTKTAFYFGSTIDTHAANFNGLFPYSNGAKGVFRNATIAAGSLKPNALGMFDMHGNVWEWCADWYDANYYAVAPSSDPTGPAKGLRKVLRGGCWSHTASDCRSASRDSSPPTARFPRNGFRLALATAGVNASPWISITKPEAKDPTRVTKATLPPEVNK